MNHLKPILILIIAVIFHQNGMAQPPCPRFNPVTVTSTANGITAQNLQWAIGCINNNAALTTIHFNIPGAGQHVITPNTTNPLPIITKIGAFIDGDSDPDGEIVLDGSNAGAAGRAIAIQTENSSIRGLTIRDFQTPGINLLGGTSHTIQNNTLYNNQHGIQAATPVGSFSVQNNVIGDDANGGNQGIGVAVLGNSAATIVNNTIALNATAVRTLTNSNVLISQNSIYCNSDLPIERNFAPNAPVITLANPLIIQGTRPNNSSIEIFKNIETGCAGAPCQGKTLVGVVPAGGVNWSFNASGLVAAGEEVTATATVGGVNTSAFSACAQVIPDCSTFNAAASSQDVACFGGRDGSATALPTGGTPPYNFLWDTGLATQTITNLPAGSYTVQITDRNGCIDFATVVVGEPARLLAPVNSTNVLCFGGNTGSASVNPAGGTTPYSYRWNTNATTQTISNLTAGNYTVTVTDANRCTQTATIAISQPNQLLAVPTGTNLRCFGANNGSATANPAGGIAPYTYRWSNNATTRTINNLPAGNYLVTVTDANRCTKVDSIRLTQPAQLSVAFTTQNVACFGGNTGSVTTNPAGGTPPYRYAWSNGATSQNISNLTAGNYTLTVIDANDCQTTQTANIAQSAQLSVTLTTQNVACFGGNNGTANANPAGGTPPYRYSWSNGATSQNISNLTAGNYTLTVTDANNCQTTQTANITQPAQLLLTITKTDETAPGANNGSASANPAGGTLPYRYAWSNGRTNRIISNLAPGIYTVTVTDANNCQISLPVTIAPAAGGACLTEAGRMDATLVQVCQTEIAKGKHLGGQILDADDVLLYALHDRADTVLGNIAVWNRTPEFAFQTGMTPGRRYFISAVAGNNDGQGVVNLADPCLSVSAGEPVIFQKQPAPVYALQAPDTVCGNDIFKLKADDLFPNPVVRYRWLLPTGQEFETAVAEYAVNPVSNAFSGDYFARRDSAGCVSVYSAAVPVEVVSLPAGAASAARDTTLCGASSFVLNAANPPVGIGRWTALQPAVFQDINAPITAVSNLQTGRNVFLWTVGIAQCPKAAVDTVVVFVEQAPVLANDEYTLLRFSDVISMHVLLNDQLAGISDTIMEQLTSPVFGNLDFLFDENKFRFSVTDQQRGRAQFQYMVCTANSVCGFACDSATVTIHVLGLPEVPEGLAINGDGYNETLQIRGLTGFSRVEMLITNRWGDVVYQNDEYDNGNPWRGDFRDSGTPLPEGAYYYVLKAFDDDELVGSPQTGVIHIFR